MRRCLRPRLVGSAGKCQRESLAGGGPVPMPVPAMPYTGGAGVASGNSRPAAPSPNRVAYSSPISPGSVMAPGLEVPNPLHMPQLAGGAAVCSMGMSCGQLLPMSSLGRQSTSLDGVGLRRRTGVSSNTLGENTTSASKTSRAAPMNGAALTGVYPHDAARSSCML